MYIADWDFLKLVEKKNKKQDISIIPLLYLKIAKMKQFNYLVRQILTAKASSDSDEIMFLTFGLV